MVTTLEETANTEAARLVAPSGEEIDAISAQKTRRMSKEQKASLKDMREIVNLLASSIAAIKMSMQPKEYALAFPGAGQSKPYDQPFHPKTHTREVKTPAYTA